MLTTYAVEPWPLFAKEAEEAGLWRLHWQEIAQDADIPLEPDHATYTALDQAGQLHVVTARAADGTLIGYWVGLIRPHLHYATTLHAFTDVYWLHPAYRRGLAGYRLFQAVERTLARRGVVKVMTATKVYQDVSRLFERLGYRETERQWTKRLDGKE
jgi:GNAT superfamily N-acetyltransferase